jgi:hypothetical protein
VAATAARRRATVCGLVWRCFDTTRRRRLA